MGWAGGAVRTQGQDGRRQVGEHAGALGGGWRGARAAGSGGPGREAAERPLSSVPKPLPCTHQGLGAGSSPGARRALPHACVGRCTPQRPTRMHVHTWCTSCRRVHTQLPRPDSREAILAPRALHPRRRARPPPHCLPRPHLRGRGVSAPRWPLAPTLPHCSAGRLHTGPLRALPRPLSGRHSGPGTSGPWWAARVFGQGSGRGQALEPPPLLLATGAGSWSPLLFLGVLNCLCVLTALPHPHIWGLTELQGPHDLCVSMGLSLVPRNTWCGFLTSAACDPEQTGEPGTPPLSSSVTGKKSSVPL